MAETDITLSVDLDVVDAEKTAEQLHKEITDIFKSRNGGQSASLTQLELQMKQNLAKAQDLRSKLLELKEVKTPTAEYSELSKRLEQMDAEFSKLLQKQEQMQELGVNSGAGWEGINNRMEELGEIIRRDQAELDRLVSTGKAFTVGTNTSAEYEKTQAALDRVNDKLKQQVVRHREISQKEQEHVGNQKRVSSHVAKTTQKIHLLKMATEKLRKSASHAANSMSNGFTNFHKTLKHGLMTILKYGIGIRSIYILWRKIRQMFAEGFKNLEESGISKYTQQIQDLKNSFATMKNALAGAFEPIATTIVPLLQRLVDWITQALDKVAQFIAVLKGQKTYIKAVKQLGNAAEKAGEQAEGSLAGFDKLNNMTSAKGSAAAGAGAGAFVEEAVASNKWADMLKEALKREDFTALGREIADKFADALNSIDWNRIKQKVNKGSMFMAQFINGFVSVKELAKALGKTIAEAFNTLFGGLNTFADTVHWRDIGNFIITGIKNFFDTADTYMWGDALGSMASGLFEALYEIVGDTSAWTKLGEKIRDTINGFFSGMFEKKRTFMGFDAHHVPMYEELNGFQLAGKSFSKFANNLLIALKTSLDDDQLWQNLGQAIGDFISEIDWDQVIINTTGLAWALIKGLFTAWDAMTDALMQSDNVFAQALGAALKTTFQGTEVVGAGIEFVDNMRTNGEDAASAFTDSFQQTYGDKTIADVIQEQGALDEALYDQMGEDLTGKGGTLASDFAAGFTKGIVESGIDAEDHPVLAAFAGIIGGIKKIFDINSPSKVMEQLATYCAEGFINPFTALLQKFSSIWNNIKNITITTVTAMQTGLSSIVNGIVSLMNSLSSSVVNAFNTMLNGIMSAINSLIESVNSAISSISNAFSSLSGFDFGNIGGKVGNIVGRVSGKVPHLAQGAVIPPNNKFLAMLGDQNSGTNIEAPLSTIEQALRNVMTEQNINVTFEVQGDPEHIFNVVRKQSTQFTRRTGLNWT